MSVFHAVARAVEARAYLLVGPGPGVEEEVVAVGAVCRESVGRADFLVAGTGEIRGWLGAEPLLLRGERGHSLVHARHGVRGVVDEHHVVGLGPRGVVFRVHPRVDWEHDGRRDSFG